MSSAQMIKDMTDGKPAAAYDSFAAAIQPAVEKHIEDLQAQVREKMFAAPEVTDDE